MSDTYILYRITPPAGESQPNEGMTGVVYEGYGDHVTIALRCQPGERVKVLRTWITRVDPTPLTASAARERRRSRNE